MNERKTPGSLLALNRLYFGGFLIFLLVGTLLYIMMGKTASFFFLNPLHSPALDLFFAWISFIGDGLFSLAVFLLLLVLRRFTPAWLVITTFLLSGLLVQLLKRLFGMPRPRLFFKPGEYPHFIDGVTYMGGHNSFPSGHSTSVFALATILALFMSNKKAGPFFLGGAILVGYSRIFLGQHFLEDVLAGSLLGTLTSLFVFWLYSAKIAGRSLRPGQFPSLKIPSRKN